MMDRHSLDTRIDGFPYLNSDRCIQAWTDIYGEVQATLDWIREPRLREIYDRWSRHNELRDAAMMKNIADYTVHHGFVHGVFLVGAAHRKSVVDKAQVMAGTGTLRVEWEPNVLFPART